MTSKHRGCGTARFRRSPAAIRTVVAVVLAAATSSPAPLLAQSSALDTTPPSVSITSPAAGERVARNVTISAAASDAIGVTTVTFKVDGSVVGTDAKPPYSIRWNTKDAADGSHTLRAEARDAAGNVGTSAAVTVIVGSATTDTTAPTVNITSPAAGAQVTGVVTLTAAASDDVGVTSVTFLVDATAIGTDTSSPYSASWNSGAVAAGSHTLRAEARDGAGNVGTSATITVMVGAAPDTTAPTVNITSPAGGAQVTGTVAISATASDDVGVTSVTFLVDATTISTDTASPFSASWNSSAVAAGSHTLRAEARDAAGNVGTSATVTVTTVAANQPPSVTMTAPVSGSSYQSPATLTLAANATDTDGSVARVDFYSGATKIGSDTASPFSMTWTVSTAGTYSFSATAVDNAGASTASGAVSVTVTSPILPRPTTAIFEPSPDNSNVIRYQFDVFPDGSNPATSTPTATQDLGKPSIVNGEMTVDIGRTTALLPPATYIATVTAVTASQSARSTASPPFVIAASSTLMTSGTGVTRDTAVAADSHGLLWVTNSTTGLVTTFDATTGDVLATIPVGLAPAGIAVSNRVGKVYVADEGSDTVSVISKTTMTLSQTIPLPPPSGRRPHHISGSPDGRFIYVGELGANVVDVIDTATDQISARFATGLPGSKTRGVIPDPGGAVLYAVNHGAAPSPGTLVALEAETGRWLWQLPIDGDPSDFLIASDGRTGVVTRHGSSAIAVIDLERRAVVKEIDPGPGDLAGTLQLTLDDRLLLITPGTLQARMGMVDLAAMTPLPPMSLAGSPAGSALPARQLSYVCVSGSSEFAPGVVAVDAGSRTVVRRFRLPGGGSRCDAVFDPD